MRALAVAAVAAAWAVIALAAGPALADPPRADDDRKARELFRLGETHYAAGRYEKAAVLYDEAFRLSGRVELLLALVNSYERMGDYAQASERLRQYLEHPRARNVAALRERLRRLERAERERIEERDRVRALEQAEREGARELSRMRARRRVAAVSARPAAPPRPSRLPAYLFLAGGAVGLAGAIGFGLAAGAAGQDAEVQCSDAGLCRTEARSALDRELAFSVAADVSAVMGVGSAAVGAYLLWKGRRHEPEGSRRALRIGPTMVAGGPGVSVAGDF